MINTTTRETAFPALESLKGEFELVSSLLSQYREAWDIEVCSNEGQWK